MANRQGRGSVSRYFRFQYIKLMRLKDQPESLAKGVATGFASGFGPFVGFGVFAALAFTMAIRGNRVAAVLTALLFKWAIPFFVAVNVTVGGLFTGRSGGAAPAVSPLQAADMGWLEMIPHMAKSLGINYFVGSVFTSPIVFLLTYWLVKEWAVRRQLARNLP